MRQACDGGAVSGIRDAQDDVRDFHSVFGLPVRNHPTVLTDEETVLRHRLHEEEYKEVQFALMNFDLVGMADGIADLIYVLLGTAVSAGIDMESIWNAVQRTNMAKLHDGKVKRRADGKILKPEGWKPPDIKALLDAQIPLSDAAKEDQRDGG